MLSGSRVYVGENTAGMQQYVQGTFATPWGGEMRVGFGKLTYWDKENENIELIQKASKVMELIEKGSSDA